MKNIHKIGENIYITNDEEIKVNDYITNGYLVWKWKDDSSLLGRKKVILTTDKDLIKDGVQSIDDEFLQWFVKNPSCEEVEVIYGLFNPMGRQVDSNNLGQNHSQCIWKHKIIFQKEEPKQEVLEEAKQRAVNYMSLKGALEPKQKILEEAACIDLGYEYDYWLKIHSKDQSSLVYIEITNWCKGAMWQSEQDKNKFSKEDMREAIIFGLDGMYGFRWGKEFQI